MKQLPDWHSCVVTQDDLVAFVDDVGFCTISPVEGLDGFPNQDDAMGIEGSLGHTWFWKDDLHIARQIYYSRVFRKRPGYLAMDMVPVFIASNGRPADELIYAGKLAAEAREIYQIIERCGPISSKELRKMVSQEAGRRSATSLIELEQHFIITKVGITGRDQHTYSYVWDLAERWMPEAFEAADSIGEIEAAVRIIECLQDVEVQTTPDLLKWLLGWEPRLTLAALSSLD